MPAPVVNAYRHKDTGRIVLYVVDRDAKGRPRGRISLGMSDRKAEKLAARLNGLVAGAPDELKE
jgi:hypothetical protein